MRLCEEWHPRRILASSKKDRETTRLRLLIASVGIERWEQRASVLGPLMRKHPDTFSRWVRLAVKRKRQEPEFAEAVVQLDLALFDLSSVKPNQTFP